MNHARVFVPVPSKTNERLCSRNCPHRRIRAVYGFWSQVQQWWRGSPRLEAACRIFDQPLGLFNDGEHIKVHRHYACLQTDHLLPTIEQYLEAQEEREEAQRAIARPANVRSLPQYTEEQRREHSEFIRRRRDGKS